MKERVRITRLLSLLAAFTMALTFLPNKQVTLAADAQRFNVDDITPAEIVGNGIVLNEAKGETTAETYIVRLASDPIASYKGGVNQLAPTSPRVTGNDLDFSDPALVAYREYLAAQRNGVLAEVSSIIGGTAEPTYVYDVAFNGFALTLTPAEAAKVANLPNVVSVQRNFVRYPQTDAGPQWIQADEVWAGRSTGVYVATLVGENEVPPVTTDAMGSAVATYNFSNSTLTVNVNTTDLTGNAAHVHQAAAGTNGGVVFGLTETPAGSGNWTGSGMLDAAQETALEAGDLYINVHSAANPGGEIRGQLNGAKGEGLVVGVIDTGVNFDHPSFADVGDDGYNHVNPLGEGNYLGFCDPAHPNHDPAFACNDKLIGAWGWPSTNNNPEDDDGHGSHTASTAAGNVVDDVSVNGVSFGTISGVAPHANIIAYDGCNATCPLDALIASINQATADNVDVVNYSIGGGPSDPWSDGDSLAFLAAREAGVMVATSAGNSGPGPGTVGSPGDAPWMLTVAASTHNRAVLNGLIDMTGGSTTPPADLIGRSVTPGFGPAEIVYAGDLGDALCLAPFAAGSVTGKIVVCDRGTNGRVEKSANVAAGGAGGFVLLNDAANGNSLSGDAYVIPGVHLTFADGQVLKAWLDSGTGHTGSIQGTVNTIGDEYGDILASFSSRGPNVSALDIIRPDVAAPGVDIVAAVNTVDSNDPAEFGSISGTSMASPHAAGASTLVRHLNPSWSPAEVQSALMLTAITDMLKEDGATAADPFDFGAGRIDVDRAVRTGLVMDITIAEYEDSNPGTGGDPADLNMPSMAQDQCLGSCSWTRTVQNVLDVPTTWTASTVDNGDFSLTVTPATMTIPAGGSATFEVTADVNTTPVNTWNFGYVQFTEDANLAPAVSLPVAVRPVGGILPDAVEMTVRRDAGSWLVEGLITGEAPELTFGEFGLVKGEPKYLSLMEDATPTQVYDNVNDPGIDLETVAVPAGALRFVSMISQSEAPDMDLYVHFDANNDGIPTEAEQVCLSAGSSWDEYCSIENPEAGNYIVLSQNWAASEEAPDNITLLTAVVTETDEGNMTVEGPASANAGEAYDIRIFWDLNDMPLPGDAYFGAFELGDASNPGGFGSIPVDLFRIEDDVVKEVSVNNIAPGEDHTLSYTITVNPNTLPEDLTYALTDTIPAGMTVVPGSVTGGTLNGNTITWNGTMASPFELGASYVQTTSLDDPSCDTGFGGYVDLSALGITLSGATGDSVVYTAFSTGAPFQLFGMDSTGIRFADDGLVQSPNAPIEGNYWSNQDLPNPTAPNGVLAALWDDLEIVLDNANGRGVRLAQTNTTATGVAIVEFDQVQTWDDDTNQYTFEVVMTRSVSDAPGDYEIVFAYQILDGALDSATVGVENLDGTDAAQYLFNGTGGAITPGLMICYDWQAPTLDPHVITYDVTVEDASGVYINTVESTVDNPGSELETTGATVIAGEPSIIVEKTVGTDASACATTDEITVTAGTEVTYCFTVTNTGIITMTEHDLEDDHLGTILTDFSYELTPGASAFITATATITQSTMNTATWTATDGAVVVEAMDTAMVNVEPTDVVYELYLPLVVKP